MQASERAQVVQFLKNHVIGRSVVAPPVTTHTDHGRVAAAYEEDAVYSNFVETAHGFAFDMTTLTRGTRYLPGKDKDGGLIAEGTLNAVRVTRYEITERPSTQRLVGFSRFVSSTNVHPDPLVGVVFIVQMSLEHGTLTLHESMAAYGDFPGANGQFHPGAIDGTHTFTLEHDRLVVHFQQERFDVDPKTLQRTPLRDKLPTQVSREITFPEPDLEAV